MLEKKCACCLSMFADWRISKSACRDVLAGSIFCLPLDSAVVLPPGTAPTVNMIYAEDLLLMLMISVTGVDFRAQL